MNLAHRAAFLLAAAAIFAAGFVAGDEQPSDRHPSARLPTDLQRVLDDYTTAWVAKDEKALAALFTEDGWVLSNGSPPVRGRARIERRYRESGGPLVLRALAWAKEGDLGYIIGGYSRHAGEPDVGKFTLTLVRSEGGRWLIVSDMDNANQR